MKIKKSTVNKVTLILSKHELWMEFLKNWGNLCFYGDCIETKMLDDVSRAINTVNPCVLFLIKEEGLFAKYAATLLGDNLHKSRFSDKDIIREIIIQHTCPKTNKILDQIVIPHDEIKV
jgi:hypothetical protein